MVYRFGEFCAFRIWVFVDFFCGFAIGRFLVICVCWFGVVQVRSCLTVWVLLRGRIWWFPAWIAISCSARLFVLL